MLIFSIFVLCFPGILSLQFSCDFDYGENCLAGLTTKSTVLVNEAGSQSRLPASDVTSIQTNNGMGSCQFPYKFSTYDMYFCAQTVANQPATCPTANVTGTKLNCSEGAYGYQEFQAGDTDKRSYLLDFNKNLHKGPHCFRFYYYFSDVNSGASIEIVLQYADLINNRSAVRVSSLPNANRWNEIRTTFDVEDETTHIYFALQRQTPTNNPFYIAIDEIHIIDLPCEPTTIMTTTTTNPATSTTTTTTNPATSTTTTTTNPATSTTTTTRKPSRSSIIEFNTSLKVASAVIIVAQLMNIFK